MVDWNDIVVIQRVADFFSKSLLCIVGLYFWEIVVTFDFEKSFFSSVTRRAWRWHYLCYFICRYSFLIALILLNITLNTTMSLNCQSMYTINQFFGNITIGTASLNLAFRALAIWRNNRVLTVLMVTLAGGHWFILFFCITTLKAASNRPGEVPSCIVTSINRPWLVALYVYTMVFDTFIMIACLWGLWRSKPRSGGRARELYKLLWSDGLMYFICASVANAFPVAFMGLALNPAMDIVSTMASACATTIASCRAVQRLNSWGTKSNSGTHDSTYKMSPAGRSGRVDTRKPTSLEASGPEHGRKPWSKRQYYPTDGDVHLASAMFAKTVCTDNERGDPRNGTQYERQQKAHPDGAVFSLQTDDRSMTSSPTMPPAWKQTPSIRSESTQATGNDKDKPPYKPTTARVSESSEQATFTIKPASLYQTSESIEEDERENEYTPQEPLGPPLSTVPLPGAGNQVIEVSPMENDMGDSETDRERQQRRQWRGQ